METDVKGCSTCPKGEERWEKIRLPHNRRINGVQYDYRTDSGELFSTVAINLTVARQKRDEWLVAKLVKEYQTDPNCRPYDWIAGEPYSEEIKEKFAKEAGNLIKLPVKCYSILPSNESQLILIKRGESGYNPIEIKDVNDLTDNGFGQIATARVIADNLNEVEGVTKAQRSAMEHGSMFGWHTGLANPDMYNEEGTPKGTKFKLWDTKEKVYVHDDNGTKEREFCTSVNADDYRHELLSSGMYPDDPTTVYQIHRFINGKFDKQIIF